MKKILLSAVSLAVLTGSAIAADLPSRKEAVLPPPPPPMWQGMYAGLNAGYNFGTNSNVQSQNWAAAPWVFATGGVANDLMSTWAPASMDGWGSNNQSGFIGGAQFGYNYQYGSNIVIGVETDIQGTGIRGTSRVGGVAQTAATGGYTGSAINSSAVGATVVNSGVDYLGTVRGRLGYLVMPSLLVYGTGGFTYGGVYAQVAQTAYEALNYGGTPYQATWTGAGQQNQLLTGWNAGGGLEWMFMPNWSLKGEALYWDMGRMNVNTTSYALSPAPNDIIGNNMGWGRTSVNYSGVQAKLGINYHFNWSAPVVAKF